MLWAHQHVTVGTALAGRMGRALIGHAPCPSPDDPAATFTFEVRDGDRRFKLVGTRVSVDRDLPPLAMRLPDGTVIIVPA